MPLRVDRISRKRLCLLVLQARRRHSYRHPTQAPADPTRSTSTFPTSASRLCRVQGCGNAWDRSVVHRHRVQRKPKSSYLRRMYRLHSLRNITRMMRGGYGFDEDDFEWDFIESDLESSEDVMLPCGLREQEAVSMMQCKNTCPICSVTISQGDEEASARDSSSTTNVALLCVAMRCLCFIGLTSLVTMQRLFVGHPEAA
eukprot:Skav219623  [mRNA]  locus=scaffold628:169427:176754:- [translate_table: standard]